MRGLYAAVTLLLLPVHGNSEDSAEVTEFTCGLNEDTCGLHDEAGPWGGLLTQWTLGATEHNARKGRIMVLPHSKGYYITDRIGLAPPPPPSHHHQSVPPRGPSPQHSKPQPTPPGGRPYDEWQPTPPPPPSAGKIVNRPPHKDKPFKPSPTYHPELIHSQSVPVYQQQQPKPTKVDRVDENRPSPQKQVSETDLYLLTAIEKLVYRADLMEKRLRKLEESVHSLVAGVVTKKPEPCAANFTRVGAGCYHVSAEAANWKGANYACRRLRANMLEMDSDRERSDLSAALLADESLKGDDYWTGGLNPGLLWIWSHSARPVVSNSTSASSNSTSMATIIGEGRCLAFVSDPALNTFVYRGQDCALKHRYICEKEEDKNKLSNEIERVAKMLKQDKSGRKPKIMWT